MSGDRSSKLVSCRCFNNAVGLFVITLLPSWEVCYEPYIYMAIVTMFPLTLLCLAMSVTRQILCDITRDPEMTVSKHRK